MIIQVICLCNEYRVTGPITRPTAPKAACRDHEIHNFVLFRITDPAILRTWRQHDPGLTCSLIHCRYGPYCLLVLAAAAAAAASVFACDCDGLAWEVEIRGGLVSPSNPVSRQAS